MLEQRGPLLRKCIELCDDVVAVLDQSGQSSAALDFAHRRVELQPLEEVGYRTLMELQIARGDRAAAVSTFHRCADVLQRELGVYPGPETTEFADRLLDRAGDAAHRRGARAETVKSIAWSGLVARDKELDVLAERWRAAIAGNPGIALVSGEPGVGKSRLLAELATIAASEGAAVATTRCFSQSGRLAFAPVADWVRNSEFRRAVEGLDPLWQEEVARLVPNVLREESEPRARADGVERSGVHGGCLAAPSVLRRSCPRRALTRAPDPARARRRALVRSGDDGLARLSARIRKRRTVPRGEQHSRRRTRAQPRGCHVPTWTSVGRLGDRSRAHALGRSWDRRACCLTSRPRAGRWRRGAPADRDGRLSAVRGRSGTLFQ